MNNGEFIKYYNRVKLYLCIYFYKDQCINMSVKFKEGGKIDYYI